MGNNRVYYGCLGVALAAPNSFPSQLLTGVQSVGIDTSINNQYFLPTASKNPTAFYSQAPDITFNYTEALSVFTSPFSSIDGLNDFIDLFMFIGEDNAECMDARAYIRCRYLLLESLTYNLDINGIFTCDKIYKGFSRYVCPTAAAITMPGCGSDSSDVVGTRKNFDLAASVLPPSIDSNALQNIVIKYTINREIINEPGTRTPYGFVTRYPIETTCSFTVSTQDLDDQNQILKTLPCEGLSATPTNMTIAVCNIAGVSSSLTINNAYLNNISYDGGNSGGGNQNISLEYTSYDNPGLDALVEFVNDPDTGC